MKQKERFSILSRFAVRLVSVDPIKEVMRPGDLLVLGLGPDEEAKDLKLKGVAVVSDSDDLSLRDAAKNLIDASFSTVAVIASFGRYAIANSEDDVSIAAEELASDPDAKPALIVSMETMDECYLTVFGQPEGETVELYDEPDITPWDASKARVRGIVPRTAPKDASLN